MVGVEDDLETLEDRWPSKNVEVYGRISKDELCQIYNRSKTHLITSGRDCFPRTIPESICCGCYNIVLDILSDGPSIISQNPIIGSVVDTSELTPILEPAYSISVIIDEDFVKRKIVQFLETEYDHFSIATLGRNLFPLGKMVELDNVLQILQTEGTETENTINELVTVFTEAAAALQAVESTEPEAAEPRPKPKSRRRRGGGELTLDD